jgi:hypothetical protein
MNVVDRFWSKVEKTKDCWLWKGSKLQSGQGQFSTNQGTVLAHRFSYELAHGKIPNKLRVLHKCDNPLCVRPDHLFLGTDSDNMQDALYKERLARQTPCDYNGKHYPSLRACWRDNQCTVKCESFLKRVKTGLSIHEALTLPNRNPYGGNSHAK